MKEVGLLVGAGMFCFFAWQGYQAGSAMGSGSGFDFDAATMEERQAWLKGEARPMARQIDRQLPKGNGAEPHMSVTDARVSAARRRIEIDIRIKGQYQLLTGAISGLKKQFVESACPSYAKSSLGRNEIYIMHYFIGRNGRRELTVGLSPVVCARYMKG